MSSICSPSVILRAARLRVSSACSAGESEPRASKKAISLRRASSYFAPARSRSASSRRSSRSKASPVSSQSLLRASETSTSLVASCAILPPHALLLPLPLKLERGPVERRAPARLAQHPDLRAPERRRRAQVVLEHALVEAAHQLGGRAVVHLPQARHHARAAGVHEAAHEAEDALAVHLAPEGGLARA